MTRELTELPPITVEHDGARAELVVRVDHAASARSLGVLDATGWFTVEGIEALAGHAAGAIFGVGE